MWARSFASNSFTSTGVRVNLLADFEAIYGAQLIGATIARIRGVVECLPTGATTASSAVMAVKVDDAGSADVRGGISLPAADWMLYEPFTWIDVTSPPVTSEGATRDNQWPAAGGRIIDVKSMRKLEEVNQELTIFFESSGATWDFVYRLSVLLMLP